MSDATLSMDWPESWGDRPVPALDLKAQYETIRDEVEPLVLRIMRDQAFVMGPEVSGLEAEMASYCQAPFGVGCASGSDALLIPLMAWEIGPGDEVITTPYSFFATAGAIWRTGAKPVFVDIDPVSFNINPDLIEAAITDRTRVLLPVHLYGQTADMEPIRRLAAQHGMPVLEDSAQAIGAEYRGLRSGNLGEVAAFSFYPSKNLGGFGDGGMITTHDEQLAKRMARIRMHGMEPRYYHHEVGFNSRLDALQAAVLRVKLRHLDNWSNGRREVAQRYHELFAKHLHDDVMALPFELEDRHHVFNQFVVRVRDGNRDALKESLGRQKIGSEIYYPVPLHMQKCFATLGHGPGDFPIAETAALETLALPMYPELGAEAQEHVVRSIARFFREQRSARAA
ncbi:MAG: DegT/DnrJ/EryC1/StrS family aminotransferase [Planctomycetota bacterium]|nr:DegT/DnrJ/EryC1/StrS family aminotransferase [Planctomycetota bacterium]